MLTILQLCSDCYGPLMVAVLCVLLAIDAALLYIMQYDDNGVVGDYLKCFDDLFSLLCEVV